jgi:adenylate cyclase
MVACVFRHGGTLDKFIGDAVMAVWGNTRSKGPRADAHAALSAALEMQQALAKLNEGWAARGLVTFRIGVAVNHGEVVVGNIGSTQRMEFTVIGESVNTTWRLEELTKKCGVDLLAGEPLADLLEDDFSFYPVGEYQLRDGNVVKAFGVENGPTSVPKNVAPRQLAASFDPA